MDGKWLEAIGFSVGDKILVDNDDEKKHSYYHKYVAFLKYFQPFVSDMPSVFLRLWLSVIPRNHRIPDDYCAGSGTFRNACSRS